LIQGTENMDRTIERPALGRRLWRLKGLWIPAALLLLAALAAYPSVSRWARSERSVERSRLRLATVVRGDLERDVAVEGRIVAAFHPTVFSPAQGLVALAVEAGQVVERGQLLARVESPDLESRLKQEESLRLSMQSELEGRKLRAQQAELENAQAVELLMVRAEAAERAMRRAQETHDQGLVNDLEYEKARDELRLTRLELEHARKQAELERATRSFEIRNATLQVERQGLVVEELRRRLRELSVLAPVAGLVSRLEVNDRDAVTPGQALVTVVDLSAFEIEIGVPEGYADEVALGTPALIRYEGRDYRGAVRGMAPEVAGGLVRGRVGFLGETPCGLKQNQRVSTRLILEARRDVLKVERGPFLTSDGGHRVYVLEGGLAVRRRIEVGAVSVAEVEIRSGLQAGETIVISDTARFRDAASVLVRQ